MIKRNIYQGQCQELLELFEDAANNAKVMCVPIDYAKSDHVAMFCNGYGDVLRKPFSIKNSPDGVEYLIDQVTKSCSQRAINTKHAFFGGEDVGSYAENFVTTLRSKGWIVAGVNAHEAKKQRENLQASTDHLDLLGIAKTLLNRRANCCPAQSGIYLSLRTLVRHRKKLVEVSTEVRNRIHNIVDRLFPGFLDENKSGIRPFSKVSLWLMQERFSAAQIRRRKRPALIKALGKRGIRKPEIKADKLQQYASRVLKPPPNSIRILQLSISQHIKHFICLKDSISQIENEIAVNLAQTQGAFLTSVRGIGIVLAAGVSAEIGNPFEQKPLRNLVSYSGIIPRVKQTGGSKGQTYTGTVSKRCNRILKDYLVQSALHMGLHGPVELMTDYRRRETTGQHADFGMARRYLRMAMCMMRSSQTYLPKRLREAKSQIEERREYYLEIWPSLHEKWQRSGALEIAFKEEHPLGRWRNVVQHFYDVKLTL